MSSRRDGKRVSGAHDLNLIYVNDRSLQTWYKRLLECKKDKSKTRKDLDKMIALFTYTSADMLVAYFLKKAQSGEGGNDGKEISALLKQHSVSLCHC